MRAPIWIERTFHSIVRLTLSTGAINALLLVTSVVVGAAEEAPYRDAVVYYANETVPEALSSHNYQMFLRVLNASDAPSAHEIREALLDDVYSSSEVLSRDIEALHTAAERAHIGLFVFSNELALDGKYLYYSPNNDEFLTLRFVSPVVDDNVLLSLSPLSRPEYLKAALNTLLDELGESARSLAVIIRSHGTYSMPFMPRVNFDFSSVDEKTLLAALNGTDHDDLSLPAIELQGTSQAMFWKILADVSFDRDVRFPLVFLSSCESGPHRVADVLSMPESVGLIIHSGRRGLSSQAIRYKDIFSDLPRGKGIDSFVSALSVGLLESGQRLSRDNPATAWRWLMLSWLADLPLWAVALPVPVWVVVVVYAFWRGHSREGKLSSFGGALFRKRGIS